MSAIEKYSEIAKNLEFCEDFGDQPLLLAHLTTDRSLIAVVSLLGGFIAMAGLGIPGALLVAFAAFNDLSYTGKDIEKVQPIALTLRDQTIEVQSHVVNEPIDDPVDIDSPAMEELDAMALPDPIEQAELPIVPSVIGNIVAPSMSVISGATTIAPSVAVAPSYGIVKDRSPVDMLVEALFSHRAIFGGQRTGKSLLASIASLGIIEKKPGTKVFYINVFAFDSAETNAMFAHAHRKVVFDLAPASQFQAASIISAVSDLFEEFVQTTGAILIIDEAATMGDIRGNHVDAFRPLVESLTGYLGSIRDSSRKRKKAVWTIAPGIVAADLDPGMKSLMKGFSPILVAIPKLRSVYWDGQLIGSDTNLIAAQLKINYPGYGFEVPQMNCDRACLIDAIWMPLGALSIPAAVPFIPQIEPPLETEESTWVAEGRSEVVFDDSWDLLLRAVATQAIVSTGLEQNIILSAVKNAQILNKTGKESEAIALLQAQLP